MATKIEYAVFHQLDTGLIFVFDPRQQLAKLLQNAVWVYLCFENEDRSLWIGSVWSGLIATCTQESVQEERGIFM